MYNELVFIFFIHWIHKRCNTRKGKIHATVACIYKLGIIVKKENKQLKK